jgi:hypothetical protein
MTRCIPESKYGFLESDIKMLRAKLLQAEIVLIA